MHQPNLTCYFCYIWLQIKLKWIKKTRIKYIKWRNVDCYLCVCCDAEGRTFQTMTQTMSNSYQPFMDSWSHHWNPRPVLGSQITRDTRNVTRLISICLSVQPIMYKGNRRIFPVLILYRLPCTVVKMTQSYNTWSSDIYHFTNTESTIHLVAIISCMDRWGFHKTFQPSTPPPHPGTRKSICFIPLAHGRCPHRLR